MSRPALTTLGLLLAVQILKAAPTEIPPYIVLTSSTESDSNTITANGQARRTVLSSSLRICITLPRRDMDSVVLQIEKLQISDSATEEEFTIDFSSISPPTTWVDCWKAFHEPKMTLSRNAGGPIALQGYPKDADSVLRRFPEWARPKAMELLSKPYLEGQARYYLMANTGALKKGQTHSLTAPVPLDQFWNIDTSFSTTVDEVRGDVVRVVFGEKMRLTRVEEKDQPNAAPRSLIKLKQVSGGGVATHERASGYLLQLDRVTEFDLEIIDLDNKTTTHSRCKSVLRGARGR